MSQSKGVTDKLHWLSVSHTCFRKQEVPRREPRWSRKWKSERGGRVVGEGRGVVGEGRGGEGGPKRGGGWLERGGGSQEGRGVVGEGRGVVREKGVVREEGGYIPKCGQMHT